MAYTPKQAKRIRKQYRRIVGAKPKGPKTMEIRGRRGAVQRGDSSFVNKAGKVVPLTRRKRLKTMERVIASGKKPVRKPVRTPVKGLKPKLETVKRPFPKGPDNSTRIKPSDQRRRPKRGGGKQIVQLKTRGTRRKTR